MLEKNWFIFKALKVLEFGKKWIKPLVGPWIWQKANFMEIYSFFIIFWGEQSSWREHKGDDMLKHILEKCCYWPWKTLKRCWIQLSKVSGNPSVVALKLLTVWQLFVWFFFADVGIRSGPDFCDVYLSSTIDRIGTPEYDPIEIQIRFEQELAEIENSEDERN